MPFYFIEEYRQGFGLSMRIEKILHMEESRYQHVAVFETLSYGRVLVLDGCVMTTDKDEFYYHEILVHPAMRVARDPRKVLIIGGGDGGTAREVLKYGSVERVDMVEIDEKVVEVSKKFFPALSCSFNEPRLNLMIRDGVKYAAECRETYDVILVDSTDPKGPAVALISEPFFRSCLRIMADDGAFAAQTESPFYHADSMRTIYRNLRREFPKVHPYFAPVPTYGGYWSYCLATKRRDPALPVGAPMVPGLRYYNDSVHESLFHIPEAYKQLVGGEE
jgi:spermidine synthase